MAVKIRLKRMGAKQKPFYRIVVADSRSPRDGRIIEAVGTYNPIKNPAVISIDEERVLSWLSKGALPTDTVKTILSKEGIIKKFADSKKKPVKKAVKKEVVSEEKVAVKKAPAKKVTTTKKTTTAKKTTIAKKTTTTVKKTTTKEGK